MQYVTDPRHPTTKATLPGGEKVSLPRKVLVCEACFHAVGWTPGEAEWAASYKPKSGGEEDETEEVEDWEEEQEED
jgi:hypothetical protein